MLEVLHKYLYGTDKWIDAAQKDSNFGTIVKEGNKDKISARLADVSRSIRDRHIIEGLVNAIIYKHFEILELLLSNDKVRGCIIAHPNLKTYRYETRDLGLTGEMASNAFSFLKTRFESGYRNLFTMALELHAREEGSQKVISNSIINILLASKLFDINQEDVIIHRVSEKNHYRYASLTQRHDEEWTDYEYKTVSRSPIFLACESGDESLVKRLLEEKGVDINVGLLSGEYTDSTKSFSIRKNLSNHSQTPLELARAKKFQAIVDLLIAYNPSFAKVNVSAAVAVACSVKAQTIFFHRNGQCGFLIDQILANDSTLTILDLNGKVSLSYENLIHIFQSLQKNHTIVELDISYLTLNKECAIALCEALKVNSSIKIFRYVLSTRANSPFSVYSTLGLGPKVFSDALMVNTTLTKICLKNHQDLHLRRLAEALSVNHSITEIDFTGATFNPGGHSPDQDHKTLIDGLERNQKIAGQPNPSSAANPT